jgi:hypothetical protein
MWASRLLLEAILTLPIMSSMTILTAVKWKVPYAQKLESPNQRISRAVRNGMKRDYKQELKTPTD